MKDALELELRQLPGVSFVSFFEEGGTSYIELVVAEGAEHARVREEAARCVVNHLEAPADIRVMGVPSEVQVDQPSGNRVVLVVVLPSDGGAAIEVQLSRSGRQYASQAVAGDTAAVGRAVLDALRGLDVYVPYEVVGLHALPSEWGAGLLAVLRDTNTGQLRRGVAGGRAPADAAARAVLNALNRSL
ncbi:MAG TPA: hypothetical protein VME20_07625 [Acidimicrobiales bacterium]|nr:hypothetical protein [Acidimicrobiales bacterium]